MQQKRRLEDAYRFPGFRPERIVKGKYSDRYARVIVLKRRSKKQSAVVAVPFIEAITIRSYDIFETFRVETNESTWKCPYGGWTAEAVAR